MSTSGTPITTTWAPSTSPRWATSASISAPRSPTTRTGSSAWTPAAASAISRATGSSLSPRPSRDPEQCRRHFSPERWTAIQARPRVVPRTHDAAGLGGRAGRPRLQRKPCLGARGKPPRRRPRPRPPAQILTLTLIDPLLLLLMWAGVAWAFGWRVMCVALIYWGTNVPGEFSWQGGAYLRQDWLAASILGSAFCGAAGWASGGRRSRGPRCSASSPASCSRASILKAIGDAVRPRRWASVASGPASRRRRTPRARGGAFPERAGGGRPARLARVRGQLRQARGDAAHQSHGPPRRSSPSSPPRGPHAPHRSGSMRIPSRCGRTRATASSPSDAGSGSPSS